MNEVVPEARNYRAEFNAPKRSEELEEPKRGTLAPRPHAKQQAPSALHRTASVVRTVVPLVQKLLPLLEGNVASAVANLMAPRFMSPPTVDLAPVESSLLKLRSEIAVIHDKSAQQDVAFKRIDDQLQTVKETLERTVTEHQEVTEEVRKVRRSVMVVSIVSFLLLAVSIGLNVALYLYVKGTIH